MRLLRKEVAAFAQAHHPQSLAVEAKAKGFGGDGFFRCGHGDFQQGVKAAGLLLGRAQGHEQFVPPGPLPPQFMQAREQAAQFLAADGALLCDAASALGQHIDFTVLREQLDLHARAHGFPRALEPVFFQRGQRAFGGADEVVHRGVARAHLREHGFGGDAAIHQPHALCLAVARFDLFEKAGQRGVVGRVAGQNFIGQRKAFRRDDQRDDHLRTIGPVIARVAVAARIVGIVGGAGLEIGAGQIVEQHFVLRAEEIAPSLAQVIKEFFLERQDLIERGVEFVDFGQTEIAAEQIGQRGALEPITVQMPFRTRREQPLGDEDLEDLIPARAFARGGQVRGEESAEAELAVKFQGEPAAAPLAGMMEREFIQPDTDDAVVAFGRGPVVGKESDLGSRGGVRRVGLKRLAPGGVWGVIDLAEIKHLTLRAAPVVETFVFNHTPIGVRLAIFFADLGTQKHIGR